MTKKPYYITTAIAYTSGKPHIGNTYEIVLADLLARFKRKQGYDVVLQTGTDEHGEKIQQKAQQANVTPKEYVDKVAGEIKRIWDIMNTTYDKFVRTTDNYHELQVQKIFEKLLAQGDIYKGNYTGWYCTPCESFWTESQLVDGKCPDCGREVQTAKEEAYFFRMSKYADKLMQYYDEHPDFIVPLSRKNEMVNNFLKPGLQDLCVSRTSFDWGIPVKSDPKHVVYVWLDALTNYITGLGYDCDGNSAPQFDKYWPADLHVIGKDIVRFHVIYWPIFLMALGLPLPKQIYGHPWLLQDGGKMSKSKGNVIYADDLVNFFGVDAVRYYLLSQMPYDNDGVIGWEMICDTVNSELANVYGNLVKRTIAMTNKYFNGIVCNKGVFEDPDDELKQTVTSAYGKVSAKIDAFKVSDALSDIMAIFRRANKYIDETAPWVLAKDPANSDRLATVLYNLTESIVIGSSMLECFMPTLAHKVIEQCGTESRDFNLLDKFGLLPDGTKVDSNPETLFMRLDSKEILEKVNAMYSNRKKEASENTSLQNNSTTATDKTQSDKPNEEITIEDFAKIDLRVALVKQCTKAEKSDKLLVLQLQVGKDTKQVVSGLAQYYTPDQLVGKYVVLVNNLKPAKLRGILSEGMILCADNGNDVVFVTPEKQTDSGSKVR